MKTAIAFLSGFAACALLFVSLGAGPGNDYERACIAVQAEGMLGTYLSKDPQRYEANKKRFEYWVKQMEQFKP